MTADVDQLPAAPWLGCDPERGDLHGFSHDEVRAIVAHATALLQAEVERLQTEIDNMWGMGVHSCHEKCQRTNCVLRRDNKRLVEALRLVETAKERGFGIDYAQGVAQLAHSALSDHNQERKDG